jgi:hypothetical protein
MGIWEDVQRLEPACTGLPFFLAGKSMGTGGAMAEEQAEGGCAQGNECGLVLAGPENGRKLRSLQEMSDEVLAEYFESILQTLGFNVREMKHMPSVALLARLSAIARGRELQSQEVFDSFAAELVRACEELQTIDGVE